MDEFSRARKRMLEQQIIARGIQNVGVLDAMSRVLRHCFIPSEDLAWAYGDGPLPIGHDQTISQPYIVALMTEMLQVEPGDRVLEIGSGSGYQAAVLAELTEDVHTVEVIPVIALQAEMNLANLGYTHVHVHVGDGSAGWPAAAPYDRILVAAAAPEVPRPLLDQLFEGGKLVIPVGDRSMQRLELWQRTGKDFSRQIGAEVCFVLLRGQYGWKD
jgi:protein-L-isoaspartate(D-aspartate) O-methyltransferase